MARLPDYLRALTDLMDQDVATVSSGDLAAAAGVNAAQLRRDLSYLGSHGVRGVGYDTAHLVAEIGARLGVGRDWSVVIIGAGRLGQALAGYPGLTAGTFRVVGLFDRDQRLIGNAAGRLTIQDVERLAQVVRTSAGSSPGAAVANSVIGVIATSAEGAQEACDALVTAGVTSVLTFTHGHLRVPAGVHVRSVDVATELAVLAFRAQAERPAAPAPDPQLADRLAAVDATLLPSNDSGEDIGGAGVSNGVDEADGHGSTGERQGTR